MIHPKQCAHLPRSQILICKYNFQLKEPELVGKIADSRQNEPRISYWAKSMEVNNARDMSKKEKVR